MTTPAHITAIARRLRTKDTWHERLLWRWLRDRRFSAYKFRRQHPFEGYILDFFCLEAMLAIELDGSQHGFPEKHHHDHVRDQFLNQNGIKVLRFWNWKLRKEKESILTTIWLSLHERAPHPLPEYCSSAREVGAKIVMK